MNTKTGDTYKTREEALASGVDTLHLVVKWTPPYGNAHSTKTRQRAHAAKAARKRAARAAKRRSR